MSELRVNPIPPVVSIARRTVSINASAATVFRLNVRLEISSVAHGVQTI